MIQVGTRNNNKVKKMIGQRANGVLKQIGMRNVKQLAQTVMKPDSRQLINDHNNADVQQEPKFQHTEPVKRKSNALERQ